MSFFCFTVEVGGEGERSGEGRGGEGRRVGRVGDRKLRLADIGR